jgi:hypothetical protein
LSLIHFAEISRIEDGPYPLLDFTSCGLTHINETYAKAANEYRVAGPFAELNSGLVEIDWNAIPSAEVTLKAIGVDGAEDFTHRVSLNALR